MLKKGCFLLFISLYYNAPLTSKCLLGFMVTGVHPTLYNWNRLASYRKHYPWSLFHAVGKIFSTSVNLKIIQLYPESAREIGFV